MCIKYTYKSPNMNIPWGRNGNPLQHFCLGNHTDRGAWWTTVMGLQKSAV